MQVPDNLLLVKAVDMVRKTEIAQVLGIHRNTVDRLLKSGELEGISIGHVIAYAQRKAYEQGVEDTRQAIAYLFDNKEHVLKYFAEWEAKNEVTRPWERNDLRN